jgi:hypothetical protein
MPAALGVSSEAVEILSTRERMGRHGFGALLEQALVNRAEAQLRLGSAERALEDATRATQLYLEKLDYGADQFEGQLANALFQRAQISLDLRRTDDGMHDLDRGMTIAERWLKEWFYDCNIGITALDHL